MTSIDRQIAMLQNDSKVYKWLSDSFFSTEDFEKALRCRDMVKSLEEKVGDLMKNRGEGSGVQCLRRAEDWQRRYNNSSSSDRASLMGLGIDASP